MSKSKKYSNLKIAWHPEKLRSFVEEKVTSPIFIRFKPTNKCNHNCFYCAYDPGYTGMHSTVDRTDELSREKMLEILENLNWNYSIIILIFGALVLYFGKLIADTRVEHYERINLYIEGLIFSTFYFFLPLKALQKSF